MRVVLNGLTMFKPRTGIGHYVAGLYEELGLNRGEDRFTLYPRGWERDLIKSAYAIWTHRKKAPARSRPGSASDSAARPRFSLGQLVQALRPLARDVANRAIAEHFQRECHAKRWDLYHEPNVIPLPCDLPTIATVHDLSVLMHPEWHPADRVRAYEQSFRKGIATCEHLIAGSEFTRQSMIQHLGISPDRITPVGYGIRFHLRPLPTAERDAGLARLGLPNDYLLYVGTLEPRKNLLTLMQAYVALPAELRQRHPLILVGGWGWKAQPIADYYYDVAAHQGVRLTGYIADSDLPILYNGARALVYPSRYEGFGLPPIEMLACGGAVLASTAEAHRETLGSTMPLIHPDDVDGWRDAMQRMLTEPEWRAELIRNAAGRTRQYSWRQCAHDTLAVYRRVLGQAAPALPFPASTPAPAVAPRRAA
ncbi:glycosyltransferase family 4 protein [Tuwongella immobilis]|uniref:Glycosyl transferase family 1 domain-containing protein n=1 Tax=Tuwongella immobilis TaxID=692036 RepID=A0A6C2YVR8_9BACT|nr:glycosyltransferase family 1 protein [Tuwongella immobilis]VIP04962.1 Glycosyl transferase group 1 OS=Acidovorax ebreus (strain TPSY) GN=Dtpsy_0558 PE=4 SV=1: Glycos_transf_1 [Tuwongella immobilis]VTS07282.1 Glycosyl transferase group 1 OS=Acidovorax ebreus (strain TPSY) GN=Dtpsy_0558 PE=4 SV=1: Glycos_transf_1 [Tuwongella immobilis]